MTVKEEIRIALEQLAARRGGRLTPDEVLHEARDKDSPLHECFTWSNAEAAQKQRLHEARELIRAVRVTSVVNERVYRTIAYVRDPSKTGNEQGYISTATLRTDADLAREVLVEEFGRAASAMKRALEVSEALAMRDKVQGFIDSIQSLKSEVETRA